MQCYKCHKQLIGEHYEFLDKPFYKNYKIPCESCVKSMVKEDKIKKRRKKKW